LAGGDREVDRRWSVTENIEELPLPLRVPPVAVSPVNLVGVVVRWHREHDPMNSSGGAWTYMVIYGY
jgi:hypothetical protein